LVAKDKYWKLSLLVLILLMYTDVEPSNEHDLLGMFGHSWLGLVEALQVVLIGMYGKQLKRGSRGPQYYYEVDTCHKFSSMRKNTPAIKLFLEWDTG
jgi:hypothetical protein